MSIDHPSGDRGRITAEYAVGVTGAACIACVFWTVFGDGDANPVIGIFDHLKDLAGWFAGRVAP
jgi:hypothetical protein